jgi:hypothetical protein
VKQARAESEDEQRYRHEVDSWSKDTTTARTVHVAEGKVHIGKVGQGADEFGDVPRYNVVLLTKATPLSVSGPREANGGKALALCFARRRTPCSAHSVAIAAVVTVVVTHGWLSRSRNSEVIKHTRSGDLQMIKVYKILNSVGGRIECFDCAKKWAE